VKLHHASEEEQQHGFVSAYAKAKKGISNTGAFSEVYKQ
jgi:hypothetical protein